MEPKLECKFCNKSFSRDTTLAKHMCVKKRRYMDIDTTGSRLGFRSFQKFFELTTRSKHPKSQQEFIESPYYSEFARFGNHLANLNPIYVEQYLEFLIRNGLKLKDWTKDEVYFLYIEDLVKKEPANSAAERTISGIMEWCEQNKIPFSEFFSRITANEGAYLIQTGRISPWVLYLCTTGENLMNRFSEDHSKMIGGIIDPGFWMKKFKKANDDVEYIKNILEQAGL